MSNRYSLIRTEYVQRYHLQTDNEAQEYNAFKVTLPPLAPMIARGESIDEAWREALATLRFLRQLPNEPLYASTVFVPFAYITAIDIQRESQQLSFRNLKMCGDDHPSHAERVNSLCSALDLLDVLDSTNAQIHTRN